MLPPIPPDVIAKFALLVVAGPAIAMYGFLFDPGAPPQIFAAQFEQSFGKPPPQIIPRPPLPTPTRPVHKHVTVTRPT